MIKRIAELLKPSNHKKLKVSTDQEVVFTLSLPEIEVGKLIYQDGVWSFSYSEEFKASEEFEPITDFPNKEKTYKDSTLWPFFISRIPSISRSRIKNTVEKENLDRTDLLIMLERFGKKTITNPYILESN